MGVVWEQLHVPCDDDRNPIADVSDVMAVVLFTGDDYVKVRILVFKRIALVSSCILQGKGMVLRKDGVLDLLSD